MTKQGKRYYWLKLHENFFRQAVIRFLRKMPEGDSIVIIYLELLLMSIKTDGYVRTDGLYDTMEKDLALILDEPLQQPVVCTADVCRLAFHMLAMCHATHLAVVPGTAVAAAYVYRPSEAFPQGVEDLAYQCLCVLPGKGREFAAASASELLLVKPLHC